MSRTVRPLRVLAGFVAAYVGFLVVSLPFLLVNAAWLDPSSASGGRFPIPPLLLVAAFVVARSAVNLAFGYYAQPLLRRWLRPAETLIVILALAAVFAVVMSAGMLTGQLSVLTVLGIVPFGALALGAWLRFRRTPAETSAASVGEEDLAGDEGDDQQAGNQR